MYKKNRKGKKIIIIASTIILSIIVASIFIIKNKSIKGLYARDGIIGISNIIKLPSKLKENKKANEENEKLKQEIEQLKAYEKENEELKKEIGNLKKTLEITTTLSEKKYINASVVNRNLGYWTEKLTIDKGINNEIESNMAVISNGTLIGLTSNTSQFSSDVTLLCNMKFPMNISVKINIGDREIYGILNNYSNNEYEIIGVVENIQIPENSKVTTTGLGNTFPSGIYIGTVSSVETDNFDLSKVVHVKPGTNFDEIKYVTVIKRGEQ